MRNVAFITGITGQDGSYLAEQLLDQNYEVHGLIRRASTFNTQRIEHLRDNRSLHLHYGDITDYNRLLKLLKQTKPTHIFNLAAMSHVQVSFDNPWITTEINSGGAARLWMAADSALAAQTWRGYQASSSEMYGDVEDQNVLNESSPLNPVSPYGRSKKNAHEYAHSLREQGTHIACGILFNHESERRGETFVTRKITRAATRIKLGLQHTLHLGNPFPMRDWGYAPEYTQAMIRILEHDTPEDFVVATGQAFSVKQFLHRTFDKLNLDVQKHVTFANERLIRTHEVNYLLGDASKAQKILGWTPNTTFDQIIERMIDHDLTLAQHEFLRLTPCHKTPPYSSPARQDSSALTSSTH